MTVASNSSTGIEDMYRQNIEENMRTISQFPIALQSALMLSETFSPSENAATDLREKTAVSECLNAIKAIGRLSAELDILSSH